MRLAWVQVAVFPIAPFVLNREIGVRLGRPHGFHMKPFGHCLLGATSVAISPLGPVPG
jgi:hypothetical protein